MEVLVFETALGHAALARQSKQVLGLSFGHRGEAAALAGLAGNLTDGSHRSRSPRSKASRFQSVLIQAKDDELADRIAAFAKGESVDFDDIELAAGHLTAFGRKVTAACRAIPYGETRTYGQLAEQAGRPKAARAVGTVMARNRVPLIVPCHRVVPASGKLGGFSAPQGVSMKKRLLEMEEQAAGLITR